MTIFLRELFGVLDRRLAVRPISRSRQPAVQAWLDAQWSSFCRAYPGAWLLAEGCAAVRLGVRLDRGLVLLRWETMFRPGARYGLPAGEVAELGVFREYDLYATYRDPKRPVLVCRWGPGRKGAVWELGSVNRYPPPDHAPALREAWRRAQLANALAGTPWAEPSPAGCLGVPVAAGI